MLSDDRKEGQIMSANSSLTFQMKEHFKHFYGLRDAMPSHITSLDVTPSEVRTLEVLTSGHYTFGKFHLGQFHLRNITFPKLKPSKV